MQPKDPAHVANNDGHMKTMLRFLAGLALAGAVYGPAAAADSENGQKLAEHWCAACHLVSPAQKQASADVPTFADIARRKDARQLALFLTKPHGQMPDMTLSQPEVADLVGYILSLGPNPPPPEEKPQAAPGGLSGAIAPSK